MPDSERCHRQEQRTRRSVQLSRYRSSHVRLSGDTTDVFLIVD